MAAPPLLSTGYAQAGAPSRRSAAARARVRAWTFGCALAAACLGGPPALAFDPADIVAGTPDSERALRQVAAVAAARRALDDAAAGTAVALSAEPELAYGADIEDPARLGAAVGLRLELGWRSEPDAELTRAIELLGSRERLRHWRRVQVRDALRLHGKLLRAELALRRAEVERLAAEAAAPNAPAVARARAVVAARRHAMEALRHEAARLGFGDAASFVPLRFAVPEASAPSLTRQRLALELERARLRRDALPFEQLPQLSLDATYESRSYGYQVDAALSLERGRPAATLNGQLGPQEDDQWSITLSARLRVDDGDEAARRAAEERVRRARAALADYDARHPEEVGRGHQAVADAWALLEAELAAWRADGATRDPSTAPACRARLARENAVYGAWLGVVSATFEQLEAVDGAWSVERARPATKPQATARMAAAYRFPDLSRSAGRNALAEEDVSPGRPVAAPPWPARPTSCEALLRDASAGRP